VQLYHDVTVAIATTHVILIQYQTLSYTLPKLIDMWSFFHKVM